MPKMTGIEFLTYVKERAELKSIPFIMLSNDNSTSLKIATLQKGARDFITKPIEPIVFKARLLKALQIN
jgi:PleD family two-component response regulator